MARLISSALLATLFLVGCGSPPERSDPTPTALQRGPVSAEQVLECLSELETKAPVFIPELRAPLVREGRIVVTIADLVSPTPAYRDVVSFDKAELSRRVEAMLEGSEVFALATPAEAKPALQLHLIVELYRGQAYVGRALLDESPDHATVVIEARLFDAAGGGVEQSLAAHTIEQ